LISGESETLRIGAIYATWNGGFGQDGCEHGSAAREKWPRMRRF
jgi:hypothetical protein